MKPQTFLLLLLALVSLLCPIDSEIIAIPDPSSKPADSAQVSPSSDNQKLSDSSNNQSDIPQIPKENKIVVESTFFINQPNGNYFYAQVVSQSASGSIEIKAVSSELQRFSLTIKKENPLKYVDSMQNFFLVKQVKGTSLAKTLSDEDITVENIAAYYLYELRTTKNGQSWLEAVQQFINPLADDSSFTFSAGNILTNIVELDNKNKFIYLVMKNILIQRIIIYKVDIANRGSTLIATAWFNEQGKNIVGGNSRVLIDQIGGQAIILSNETVNFSEQTKYTKKNFSQITSLTLNRQRLAGVRFVGSFFFFGSTTNDFLKVNGLLYSGYGDVPVSGELQMTTQTKFNYLADNINYFISVGSQELIWVQVYQNQTTKTYENYTLKLSQSVKDQAERKAILDNFNGATKSFYHDNKVFFLTQNKFFVYKNNQSQIQKLYEADLPVNGAKFQQSQGSVIKEPQTNSPNEQPSTEKSATDSPEEQKSDDSPIPVVSDSQIPLPTSSEGEIQQVVIILLNQMNNYHRRFGWAKQHIQTQPI